MTGRPLQPFLRVGQVVLRKYRDDVPVVKVRVQKMQLDQRLLMYFQKKQDYWSIDTDGKSKVGDIVVIRNLATSQGRNLNTYVHNTLYETGNIIDPVTKQACRGLDFVSEEDRESETSRRSNIDLISSI